MTGVGGWPSSEEELGSLQLELAAAADAAPPWLPPRPPSELLVGGVWFCAPTGSPGNVGGEPAWAAAVLLRRGLVAGSAVARGQTGAAYRAGFLALREGLLLEAAVRTLERPPDVLLVNATGRDHPRRAGLALHLGAVLDVPTVGVTDRPLLAAGGASVETRPRARPVVVDAAWRTSAEVAREVVLATATRARTPEPLRAARRLARETRARDEGRAPG